MSINNITVQTQLAVQAHTYCIEAEINLFFVVNIDPDVVIDITATMSFGYENVLNNVM